MPRLSKAAQAAEQSRLAARRAEAYRLHCQGWTQAKIGQHQGLSREVIADDLRIHRSTIPAEDIAKVRQDHLRQLAMLRESMFELSQMDGAVVTSGKDGGVVRDPETGAVQRDFGLRVAATKELRALIEREAKQLGTDASAKVELSGEVAVAGSIEQELTRLADLLGLGQSQTPLDGSSQSAEPLSAAE